MIFKGGFTQIFKEISLSNAQRNFLFFVLVSFVIFPILNSIDALNDFFTHSAASGSRYIIGVLSDITPHGYYNSAKLTYHVYDSRAHVLIGDPCNGFDLLYVCVAFIISIPGIKWKRKILFSVMGITILFLSNLLRITALFFVAKNLPEWFDTFHKTVFQLLVYGIMFAIWIVYLKPLHGKKIPEK
jgi:exosortase/archaeosortase family protein